MENMEIRDVRCMFAGKRGNDAASVPLAHGANHFGCGGRNPELLRHPVITFLAQIKAVHLSVLAGHILPDWTEGSGAGGKRPAGDCAGAAVSYRIYRTDSPLPSKHTSNISNLHIFHI